VGDGISLDTEQWKIGSSAKCAWLLDDTWSVGRPTIVHGNTDGNNLVIDVHVQELRDALDRPIVSIPRFLPALTRGCIA
jgi:hypothetical protein